MHTNYFIDGTKNICERELEGREYNDPSYYPNFQKKIDWFKKLLLDKHKKKESLVVLRVFDGEFYFLDMQKIGNVARRHCSKELTEEFVKKFKDGCYKVDILSTQLYEDKIPHFQRLFPNKKIDLPMEIIYGLFANKWLLETFKNKIALIGGNEKMDVIKKLMEHQEYRDYIHNDYFLDYISVPEKYSSDDPDKLLIQLEDKIKKSKAAVFFYGIGIAKMAIAYKFKEFKKALFIDVGCGISALAGTCAIERPYFGDWINYRLEKYDYSKMDKMDFKKEKDNIKIIKSRK